MIPPAPGRLSTSIGCFHVSTIFCSSARAILFIFFFNDTATTEIYTLSLHDALPISYRRQGRGRLRGMHAPGLPTVVRRARRPAALPVPFDVVYARRPGADASIADISETVAHVDGSRTKRRDRGVRPGTAEQAGLATCNPPPYLLATSTFPPKME